MAPTIEIVGYMTPTVRTWQFGSAAPRRMGPAIARIQVADPLVRPTHCVVTQDDDGRFWVSDSGYKNTPNGTWLTPNGDDRLAGTMLDIGDPLEWQPGWTLWIGTQPIPRPGQITANGSDDPYNLGTAWGL